MSVILKTNGKVFSGWIAAEVTRSLRAVSGHFSITYSDKWGPQSQSWKLQAGDECTLELDGDVLITGFIDTVENDISKDSYSLSVTGRDKTGDLVDSGSLLHQKSFKGVSLKQMAQTLASPFGVSVSSSSKSANDSIDNVTLQYHETVWEIISRLAQYQGVLAYPDAVGGIVFSDVSDKVVSVLDEKSRIIEINTHVDASQKFQKYVVVSHSGTADRKVTTVTAEVMDHSVKSPRSKIIVISKNTEKNGAQARANWEMAMCTAKSFYINLTVLDWRNENKELWQINTLVSLNAKNMGIYGMFLIESIRFSFDKENGISTQLTLVLKDSYNPNPDRKSNDNVDL